MTHSPAATDLVASFEGFRSVAYQDQGGVWTIGYGHTGGVSAGQTCTMAQALSWLDSDLATADAAVSRLVTVPLTQNQFDALVSFTYNVGQGHLASSTLLKRLNSGDPFGAAASFLDWDKVNGKIVDGLARRRIAERDLFTKGLGQ